MKEIVLRPKGVLYILLTSFYYIFMLSLSITGVMSLLFTKPLTFGVVIIIIIEEAILISLLILQTRELVLYKIIIKESKVWIAANRELFLVRHKNMNVSFKGIQSMQYKWFVDLTLGIGSAIVIWYDNDKMKYINTMRFSKKQIDNIIQIIKDRAEKLNGYAIEIKPEEIQGKSKI